MAEPPAPPPIEGDPPVVTPAPEPAQPSTAPATPVVAWDAPVEATGPAPGLEYAPHGARFVAYLLDSLLLFVIDLVLMIPLLIATAGYARDRVTPSGPEIALSVLLVLGLLVVNVLYFPAFWASGGQTPGMRPFRLRVVRDRDGGRFGWGTALLRLLGLYVASAVFYLGFIWIFIDKRRRGWHDLIAGTVVVRHVGGPVTKGEG